jgi:hypothetical protein
MRRAIRRWKKKRKNYGKRNENICEEKRNSRRIKWRYVVECGNSEQVHLSVLSYGGCKCCPEKGELFNIQSDFLAWRCASKDVIMQPRYLRSCVQLRSANLVACMTLQASARVHRCKVLRFPLKVIGIRELRASGSQTRAEPAAYTCFHLPVSTAQDT